MQNCPSTQYVLQNYKVSWNSVERFQRKGTVDWQTGQKHYILRNSLCGVVVVVVLGSGWGGGYIKLSNILISIHFSSSSPTYICAVKLLKKLVYQFIKSSTHVPTFYIQPVCLPDHKYSVRHTCWDLTPAVQKDVPTTYNQRGGKNWYTHAIWFLFFEKPGHKGENGMDAIYHRFQFYSKICLEHSPLH